MIFSDFTLIKIYMSDKLVNKLLSFISILETKRREMAEKVFMDTNVFTGIVGDIQSAADNLVLSDNALKNSECLEGFPAGIEILESLREVHTTSKAYRFESAVALPKGLLTLRDSLIEVDKELSNSLRVEKIPGGVRIESKR